MGGEAKESFFSKLWTGIKKIAEEDEGLKPPAIPMEAAKPTAPQSLTPTPTNTPAQPKSKRQPVLTEKYLARVFHNKGPYYHEVDMQKVYDCIQRLGEAKAGDIEKETGFPRSTLVYYLNKHMRKNKIERVGGGRSVRYRIVWAPPTSQGGDSGGSKTG